MSTDEQTGSGTIIASYGNRGRIDTGTGKPHAYVMKGKRQRAVCGDRVDWRTQSAGHELLITRIHDRDNTLERPDSRGKTEPIAANVSRLLVVVTPEPEADLFIADRYLCAAELMGAEALLVWNKADLQPLPDAVREFADLGYPLLETSALDGMGIEALREQLTTGVSMLVGQSGVGKSSLINQLLPNAEVATGELSAASGEGKHTTTASFMHKLPGGGCLIDSPGVREFAPVINDPQRIQVGFREIAEHAIDCRFANCQHLREPNCAVKAAVETGAISARRYESYKRLQNTARSLLN